MLKIDYIINRKLSDTTEINLKPDKIPSNLPNIVYIEGPNDSGKSTILNLIALGFYGQKNKNIKDSLKAKMDSLLSSNHQKLKFEIIISNKNNTLTLKSKKMNFDDDEILVEEKLNNGKYQPLSYDLFEKRYRLIYDIPERPTERLYDLLNELEYEQNRVGEKIKRFNIYIYEIIKKIEESRSPERLKTLKKQVTKLKKDNNKIRGDIPIQKKLFNELSIYYYIFCYCKYYNEL
ncbi:MAG: AAA family ATPase, partial [Candidatus Hodarchaeota archaeon]